jgi:hypothetical protein
MTKIKLEQTEFDYIIDSIVHIFNHAPRVEHEYICHGEYHCSYGVDEEIRNENLKEFMQKYFEIRDLNSINPESQSKVKLFGENIKDAIKIIKNFKEQEPLYIPKHGILKKGF